jgi:hypothetical protein
MSSRCAGVVMTPAVVSLLGEAHDARIAKATTMLKKIREYCFMTYSFTGIKDPFKR